MQYWLRWDNGNHKTWHIKLFYLQTTQQSRKTCMQRTVRQTNKLQQTSIFYYRNSGTIDITCYAIQLFSCLLINVYMKQHHHTRIVEHTYCNQIYSLLIMAIKLVHHRFIQCGTASNLSMPSKANKTISMHFSSGPHRVHSIFANWDNKFTHTTADVLFAWSALQGFIVPIEFA